MNQAEQIAKQLDNDGQNFTAPSGETIAQLVAQAGGRRDHGHAGYSRWLLPDGSTIVELSSGWDLGYDHREHDCACWKACGHSEECASLRKIEAAIDAAELESSDVGPCASLAVRWDDAAGTWDIYDDHVHEYCATVADAIACVQGWPKGEE